jgi:hypothetical protein
VLTALIPATAAADDYPVGATLTVLAAPVQVALGPFADYTDAQDSQLLHAGDLVRTGPGGLALLTYFDGSESQLDGSSELRIDLMEASPAPRIQLFQGSGVTVNHVVPMPPGGRFETDTPAATGLVRGTSFVVAVDQPNEVADDSSSNAVPPTTSVVLLADPDGRVGRVDLAPHAKVPVVELRQAGEVGAASGQAALKAQLGAPALRVLSGAAHDHNDGLAASQAAEHARSLVVAARVAMVSGQAPVGDNTLLSQVTGNGDTQKNDKSGSPPAPKQGDMPKPVTTSEPTKAATTPKPPTGSTSTASGTSSRTGASGSSDSRSGSSSVSTASTSGSSDSGSTKSGKG